MFSRFKKPVTHQYLCLLFALIFFSCKKDEDTPEGLKDEMIGRWSYVTLVENDYQSNGDIIPNSQNTYTAKSGDYIEFKKDGSCTTSLGGSISNSTYTTSTSGRFTLNTGVSNSCRVVSISNNAFVFIVEGNKIPGYTYIEFTHTLKK